MEPNNLHKDVPVPPEFSHYAANYPGMPMMGYYVEPEVTILDYWRVFWARKWLIMIITLLCGALAVGVSLIMSKKYKTQASIMPLTSSGSSGLSNLASQVSSIPLVGSQPGGLGALGGGKSKELVNILKSRTLSEKVIDKLGLMKVIFARQYDPASDTYRPNWMGVIPVKEDAINVFQKKISDVEEDKKTGLIKVQVKLGDPALAAKIANEMVIQLQAFIENNSLTLSKRNRIFIEQQLVKNGAKLLEAGKELNNFYGNNRISSIIPQLDVNVGSFESLPKPFEDFNAELLENQRREENVNKQLADTRVKQVPGQIVLQFLTLKRELIARSHALLTQQYELAKIEESKEDLAFQVIDKADVKVRPSSPKLILNVAIGIFGGFFVAVFIAFFSEYIRQIKAKESPR
ncbi:hypothetical protein FBR05_00085 [Deltaproteobacteria bacterium PRO3]|nr:hypothetical protein [Deltaproteobacteria bacterium PRO3]